MEMMSRRRFLELAGAGFVVISLTPLIGCGGNSAPTGNNSTPADNSTPASDVGETKPVVNPGVEPLNIVLLGKDSKIACNIIALKKGYFEQEGLQMGIQVVSGGFPEAMPALSKGTADVLPFGSIPTCTYIGQGDDLVIFGGTVANGSECITLIENKDRYKKASDFKGKRIGCFRMETGHMVTKSWLRKQGLKIGPLSEGNDVEFVLLESAAAEVAAVEKGEIDMCFVNSGYGVNALKTGKMAVAFHPNELIGHEFPCCRQSTNRDAFVNKRSALIKFEIANLRAYVDIQKDHEGTISLICEYSGQDRDYVESITYGKGDYRAAMVFEMDPYTDAVAAFYADMVDNGDIENPDKELIKAHLDSSIYKTALDELVACGENLDIYNQLLEVYRTHNTMGI